MCFKAARRQIATVVELPSVGHPLVDQDHARAKVVEEAAECVTGTRALFVVSRDSAVGVLASELPCEFAPIVCG